MNTQPQGAAPAPMTSQQIEEAAIAYVLAHEKAAGRTATDTRRVAGSPTDVRSEDPATGEVRLIEVKSSGTSVRTKELWLEPGQVRLGLEDPSFHLYIVENVRSGSLQEFRLIDVDGQALRDLLAGAREKHYFEIPVLGALYDRLAGGATGQ